MDFDSCRKKLEEAGPHPGLSGWQEKNVLLYRCRDISQDEFRDRFLAAADRLEPLLEQGLPENLDPETYQVASDFYQAATKCLDTYLEGIEEILHWSDTGDAESLSLGRTLFVRGDQELNQMFMENLKFAEEYQELDYALMRSMGIDLTGNSLS